MKKKLGRNDPCACGSGEKYKRCCLSKHRDFERLEQERINALFAAVDWLDEHHEEEVQTAFLTDYLDVLEDREVARFEKLPEDLREAWINNAYDWLIAEGEIEVDDGETSPVLPMLLNQLELTEMQHAWLRRVSESPVALYRMTETRPGSGWTAERLSDPQRPRVEIDQQTSLDAFEDGDLLGLRLVPTDADDGKYWLTSAVYAFDPREEEALLRELREGGVMEGEDQPWTAGNALIDLWIEALAAETA